MQKTMWALIVAATAIGVHWFANPSTPKSDFKPGYQTRTYSQTKRDSNGRLHKVTKTFFSDEDNARRLTESP